MLLLRWGIKRDSFWVISVRVMTGSTTTLLEMLDGRATHDRQVTSGIYMAFKTLHDLTSSQPQYGLFAQLLPATQVGTPDMPSLKQVLSSHFCFSSTWNDLSCKSFRTQFQCLLFPSLCLIPQRERTSLHLCFHLCSTLPPAHLASSSFIYVLVSPHGCELQTAGDVSDSSACPTQRLA